MVKISMMLLSFFLKPSALQFSENMKCPVAQKICSENYKISQQLKLDHLYGIWNKPQDHIFHILQIIPHHKNHLDHQPEGYIQGWKFVLYNLSLRIVKSPTFLSTILVEPNQSCTRHDGCIHFRRFNNAQRQITSNEFTALYITLQGHSRSGSTHGARIAEKKDAGLKIVLDLCKTPHKQLL